MNAAAKKAKCKEAKEKRYGRQARKVRARSKNEEAEGRKCAKQPLIKRKCKEAKEKGYGRQERKS
ncbi:MAG: hypothetical protein ACLR23_04450 [Clostridia bacterium]